MRDDAVQHSIVDDPLGNPAADGSRVAQSKADVEFADRLMAARLGCRDARGIVLQQCQQFLRNAARRNFPRNLQGKLGDSDLVQDTLLLAHQRFERFAGATAAELQHWLGRILVYRILTAQRRFAESQKRDVSREVSIPDLPPEMLPLDTPSPSARAMSNENFHDLQLALARLRPAERQVIEMRNLQLLSFDEIGRRLDRTADAMRKAWARAMTRLVTELQTDDSSVN